MAPRSKEPATSHPDVLTIAELAAYLRCNKCTIYRLIKKEKLPAFRIGSDWRFKRELIEKWMEEQPQDLIAQARQGILASIEGGRVLPPGTT